MYAFIVRSSSNEYTLWTASNGDIALPSSVKNLPTDPLPTTISKITTAPYVGGLFLSQNSQTWNVDQNQALMFTLTRCKFDTTQTPNVRMVVPTSLPERKLVDATLNYYSNANNLTNIIGTTNNSNIKVDAFNITTTDFIPTTANVNYQYNATLQTGSASNTVNKLIAC